MTRALGYAALALSLVAGGRVAFQRPTIHLVGDSTMAERADPAHPERGWGEKLASFLDSGVVVRNHAVNGRSTKSFIDEGRWEAVRASLRPGDVVVVQFGHNDQKSEDPRRYTAPWVDFRRNLERFVDEARAAGATPVLASPIVRRSFESNGRLRDTHGEYHAVVQAVARERGVPFLDLRERTEAMVQSAGPDASKRWFVHLAPGESTFFPDGRQDDTHLSAAGATAVARLAAEAMRSEVPMLRAHVRVEAMTRREALRRALLLGAALPAACTSGGAAASRDEGRSPRNRDVIAEAEIRAGQWTDVQAMIAALRPTWLRESGPDSILGETDQVQVYVNDVRLGGPSMLRGLAVNDVARVVRVRPVDASARWGPGHSNGAILVTTVAR